MWMATTTCVVIPRIARADKYLGEGCLHGNSPVPTQYSGVGCRRGVRRERLLDTSNCAVLDRESGLITACRDKRIFACMGFGTANSREDPPGTTPTTKAQPVQFSQLNQRNLRNTTTNNVTPTRIARESHVSSWKTEKSRRAEKKEKRAPVTEPMGVEESYEQHNPTNGPDGT